MKRALEHVKFNLNFCTVNVRFAQMLRTDTKYQVLREDMIKTNTRNLVYHCRADKSDCDAALAKMRYKASKHFYALAKAVVDYVKNKRQARPTGYVGMYKISLSLQTKRFCNRTSQLSPQIHNSKRLYRMPVNTHTSIY